jgi:hypothetical protein
MALPETGQKSEIDSLLQGLSVEDRKKLARTALAGLPADEQNELAAERLSRLEPGFLPRPIFGQLARLAVLPTYEFAAVRPTKDSFEIALKQRKSNSDTPDWWEGKWHVPGTVPLASDEYPDPENETDFSVIRDRLIATEFGGAIELIDDPRPLPPVLRAGIRGKEQTVRELALVRQLPETDLPKTTRFFEVRNILSNPPDGGLVDSHDRLIRTVAEHYEKHYRAIRGES